MGTGGIRPTLVLQWEKASFTGFSLQNWLVLACPMEWGTGRESILYAVHWALEYEQWPSSAYATHWKINVRRKFISYDYLLYSSKKCWLVLWGCTLWMQMSVRWYHRLMTCSQYWQVATPVKAASIALPYCTTCLLQGYITLFTDL